VLPEFYCPLAPKHKQKKNMVKIRKRTLTSITLPGTEDDRCPQPCLLRYWHELPDYVGKKLKLQQRW
jgi:hypothetical protein